MYSIITQHNDNKALRREQTYTWLFTIMLYLQVLNVVLVYGDAANTG